LQPSKVLLAALLACAAVPSRAGAFLYESFDNIATLPGSGWVLINNSAPPGTTGWFQGVPAVFPAQSGAPDSYIAANFNNAGFGGNISNWLLTPVLTLNNGDFFSFFTRTEVSPFPGDILELRLSTNGASTNVGATASSVGDFTALLATVGSAGFPEGWTQYTVVVSGLAGPTASRLGFRYVVTDTSQNGDYIGIDTVGLNLPEPGTVLMLGSGIALLAIKYLRARA
jgi:hypothetical protein